MKRHKKADGRGEARYDLVVCDCGCGRTDWLDTRHKQRYIKGHGGRAILERRKAALVFAIEVKLIALGAGVLTAYRAAQALVQNALKLARRWVEPFYNYLEMCWL